MYQVLHNFFVQDDNAWRLHVFLIVLATACIAFLVRRGLRYLKQQMQRTENVWDDAAINAADMPLRVLSWILGINIACNIIAEHSDSPVFAQMNTLREVAIILILAWFLLRFARGVEQALINPPPGKPAVDITSAQAISKLVRISIAITAGLILLEKLGYSVNGVLAFGGIGGIAVGFAAKDLLANFFGGLMIFMDRPFSIGDWIRSPDRNIEGTVERIGWRQTVIRTPDKRPLYVPNSTFASIAVENPSRMTHRRINESIGLRYEDGANLARIAARIKAMLDEHPDIDQSQSNTVSLDKLNASSLDLLITAYTSTRSGPDFLAIKQDVFLRIIAIVNAEGADFAFPTQTLHMPPGMTLAPSADATEEPRGLPAS